MARLATALFCLLLLAGCGGGSDDPPEPQAKVTPKPGQREPEAAPGATAGKEAAPRTGPVTAQEEAVIRGWANALRRGDVERAVGYWRTPAIAANGNQPFKLLTRRAVRQFNDGLTCGARLESVERDKNYLLATFRLTERRGSAGSCGPGVGNRARTLFLLRDGKIVQWIRAADPPSGADGPDASAS